MIIFFKIIIAFLFIEFFLHFFLHYLRKDFQWLILKSIDEKPIIPKEKIEKFIANSYDEELGWIRKPNTDGSENSNSKGQSITSEETITHFSINSRGCRNNPTHEHHPVKIACYGDSFSFARHVSDDETWEWFLSELTNTNVLNYGVGNYGLDQAIIRFQREHKNNNADATIIAVVPETICRIQSVWKHYSEYGNLLGFKPRFVKTKDGLKLIPNVTNSKEKLYNYLDFIKDFKENDYFYKNKFKKDLLDFPYTFNFLKNTQRNIPLFISLILRKFSLCRDFAWQIILRENFKHTKAQYKNKTSVDFFIDLICYYKDCAEKMGTKPFFVLFPYLSDLKYAEKYGSYYSNFCEMAKDKISFLDLTENFLAEGDWEDLYNNDFYGGHLSVLGNKKAALFIKEFLNTHIQNTKALT